MKKLNFNLIYFLIHFNFWLISSKNIELKERSPNLFTELKINQEIKLKLNSEESLYFYIDITKMPKETKEGSIIFKEFKDVDSFIFYGCFLNNQKLDQNKFLEELKKEKLSYKLMKDLLNQIYEIYYFHNLDEAKNNTFNFFLIEIKNQYKEDIELILKPLQYPKTFIIENNKFYQNDLTYYKDEITYYVFKMNENNLRKESILIYSLNKCSILYSGKLIPNNIYDTDYSLLEEQKKLDLKVIKFDKLIEPEIVFTIKFNCNENNIDKFLIESTNKTVVLFNEKRENKIFQIFFDYNQEIDYYYIGSYDKKYNDYEMYLIQKIGLFNINYLNNIVDHILPNPNDKKLLSNTFLKLDTKYEIFYIHPLNSGRAEFRFFNNVDEISKNKIFNIHLFSNKDKLINLPENNNIIFLTMRKFGNSEVKCKINSNKEINLINEEKYYTEIKDKRVILNCNTNSDNLLELTPVYDNEYTLIKGNQTISLKNSKKFLIQYRIDNNYSKSLLKIIRPESEYGKSLDSYIYLDYYLSEFYFPYISDNGNPINNILFENDKNESNFELNYNPYDNLKIHNNMTYYFGIEIVESEIENLEISLMYTEKKKDKSQIIISENQFFILEKKNEFCLNDIYNQKFLSIITIKCQNNTKNNLLMNYDNNNIWKVSLNNIYNFNQIPALYNGICFDIENIKQSVMFSFRYSNEYINNTFKDTINKIKNDSFEIKIKQEKGKSILYYNKTPFIDFKKYKTKIFLMYKNDENKINSDNLCYLYEIEKNKKGIIIEFSENIITLANNKLYNGEWYMSIVCEFSNFVNSRFLVYSKYVTIKNGIIYETIKKDSKKVKIIIIICGIIIILVLLFLIFYIIKPNYEMGINQGISLINTNGNSYLKYNI